MVANAISSTVAVSGPSVPKRHTGPSSRSPVITFTAVTAQYVVVSSAQRARGSHCCRAHVASAGALRAATDAESSPAQISKRLAPAVESFPVHPSSTNGDWPRAPSAGEGPRGRLRLFVVNCQK